MSFKVAKKAIWESRGSLHRFGQLKLKGKTLIWKAGRIHRAASKVIEALQEEHNETLRSFGAITIEQRDQSGNVFAALTISDPSDAKLFKAAWEKVLSESVELPLDPITTDEFGEHSEELSLEDNGALGEWLIVGAAESAPEKAAAAAG